MRSQGKDVFFIGNINLMRKFFTILFLTQLLFVKVFSQTPAIVITGPTSVAPGSTQTYYLQLNYQSSTITWSVLGGSIISTQTNLSCTVVWNSTTGKGSITAYDAANDVTGKLMVQRGSQQLTICSVADAGPDQGVCSSSSPSVVIGTPSVPGYTYSWSPTTGLSNAYSAQPTASPSSTTTYTLTVKPQNLFVNGDFEQGLTGFVTDYRIYPNIGGVCGQFGILGVSTTPRNFQSTWCNYSNHTPGGSNMLIIDGHCQAGARIWSETVTVAQNENYTFSGWASSNTYDRVWNGIESAYVPKLRVRINGVDLINNFNVLWDNCTGWVQFTTPWSSGTNTTAVIEIYDDNLNNSANDFNLDDLSFSNCPETTDQVTVFASSGNPTVSPAGPISYYNQYETPQNFVLTASQAGSYQWYKNNVAIPGAINQTYSIFCIGNGATTDQYKVVTNCGTSNTVTFNYIGCDSPSDYPVPIPAVLCTSALASGVQLNAPSLGAGTNYLWLLQNFPTCFSVSPTGILSGSGCSIENNGVYTRSSLPNGSQTHMYYVVVANPACRNAGGSGVNTEQPKLPPVNLDTLVRNPVLNPEVILKRTKSTLSPNPAYSRITIKPTQNADKIEIYSDKGVLIRRLNTSKSTSVDIDVTALPAGAYLCKILGNKEPETIKFVIRR